MLSCFGHIANGMHSGVHCNVYGSKGLKKSVLAAFRQLPRQQPELIQRVTVGWLISCKKILGSPDEDSRRGLEETRCIERSTARWTGCRHCLRDRPSLGVLASTSFLPDNRVREDIFPI